MPEIYGCADELKQVFTNLIINAIDAMPGGGKLVISIFISEKVGNFESVIIRFSDTGCGIDGKSIKTIFNPFYTTKPAGSGMGFAVTKKIIKDHNGDISIESKLNEGTVFLIELPINNSAES